MCSPVLNMGCDPVGSIIGGAANRFVEDLRDAAAESAAEALRLAIAGWVSIDTPDVSQTTGTVAWLREHTWWATAAIAVGALLFAAGRLAWERSGKEAGSILRGLVSLVVLAGMGVPTVALLSEIGDSYSTWILDLGADGQLGERLLLVAPAGFAAITTPLMALGLALMLFTVAIVQVLLLLARDAGLILLAGLLPLAAAAGISESGREVRNRYVTWLLAFLLYKPAAATAYAAGLRALGHGDDVMDLLIGLVMFAMAIVALPALLRLIAPPVNAVTSGGHSAGAGIAAATGAAQVATGAVRLAGGGGGGGGGSARGGQSPPGAAASTSPRTPPAGGGGAAGAGAAAGKAGGAGASAGSAGAGAAGGAGASAGSAGAAAAAGPVGAAATAAKETAQAGPKAVRKVGGTGAAAVDGDR